MSLSDPTDLSAELETEAARKEAAAQEVKWEIEDWVWLVSTKRGRRIVHRLLTNAGAYRLSHVPGDPYATAFNEGQRNVGNRIIAILTKYAGEAYGLLVQERMNVRS